VTPFQILLPVICDGRKVVTVHLTQFYGPIKQLHLRGGKVRQPVFFYGEAEEEEEFAKKPMIPSSYAKAFSFFFPLAIIARTQLYYTRGNVWLLTLFYVLLRPGFVVFIVLMIRPLLPNRPTDTRQRHGERWGRESPLFILTVRPARPQEEVERKKQDPPKTW
jgi:hypothetical protein